MGTKKMTDEEEFEEVDDFDLFIEEKNNRIKELENDRHELLEKIKAIKEVLNIEEIYRLKKRNEELLKALNGLHEATIEGQLKDRVQVIKENEYFKSVIADLLDNGEMARQKALDILSEK